MRRISTLVALAIAVAMCATTSAKAQGNWPNLVEVVALDECDPTTFNAALGPDFCKNVALATIGGDATGFATLFDTLISEGPTRGRSELGLRAGQSGDEEGSDTRGGKPGW
jgi:hypothetical protein